MKLDLYEIGNAICEAAMYKEQYTSMESDRDYWRDKYQELLNKTYDRNNEMIGSLLDITLKMGEQKQVKK